MHILNAAAVAEALPHAECIAALAPTMRAISDDQAIMPLRQYLDIPGTAGKFTLMPGYVADPRVFGFKAVAKYPRDADSPYGSHVGSVMIFDAELGVPTALLDGAELTAIRTSAASALATQTLAREDCCSLAILGTGVEAWHHVQAVMAVRPISTLRIWGRSSERAQALLDKLALGAAVDTSVANTAEDAVADIDIVCTTTAAKEPILEGQWLAPGTHVNLVGAAVIAAAEADETVVTRSRFFTDFRPSAMAQAGELDRAIKSGAIDASHLVGELGEVLLGRIEGRQNDEQITTYKSLGVAAQDLAAAVAALSNAKRLNIGVAVDWA